MVFCVRFSSEEKVGKFPLARSEVAGFKQLRFGEKMEVFIEVLI